MTNYDTNGEKPMNAPNRTFVALPVKRIIEEINQAMQFVAYVAPGITGEVAESLISASKRHVGVEVILDANAEVCRMGYGTFDGLNLLRLNEDKILFRNSTGLRIGLLVCDYKSWIFTPTALILEDERYDNNTPNSIIVSADEAHNILKALAIDPTGNVEISISNAEIGNSNVSNNKLDAVKKDLETNPPQRFDIVRKVRVFNSYLEYVDISLKNCEIQRHTILLPQELFGLTQDDTMKERLRSTVKLIGEKSELSGKILTDRKNEILKKYTRQLGKPFGVVMLRANKDKFEEDIESLRKELSEHQKKIKDKLQEEIDDTRGKLIDMLTQVIMEHPPDDLKCQIPPLQKVTEDQCRRYLKNKLQRIITSPDELIKEMKLEVLFKGITYETLHDEKFIEAVKNAFPIYNWDAPFHEFDAAPAIDNLND